MTESTIYPSGNILNLFPSTASGRVGSYGTSTSLPTYSHVHVVISYDFENPNFNSLSMSHCEANRLWSKGRYDIVTRVLSGLNWKDELMNLPIELQYKMILDILMSLLIVMFLFHLLASLIGRLAVRILRGLFKGRKVNCGHCISLLEMIMVGKVRLQVKPI